MKLTNSQKKTVDKLYVAYKNKDETSIIDFKAPTGSGKTFMAANLISNIFASEYNSNKKTMIVIATVSDAELPKAFASKLNDYKKYLSFSNFEVEFRTSPSSSKNSKIEHIKNFELEENKVLVFGTSSFGKNKLFNIQGILDNFISEAKELKWNIIYIRDEAHKGGASSSITKEKQYKSFDRKMEDLASFVIQMTATPKGRHKLIELSENDLLEDNVYLLKNKAKVNDFSRENSSTKELLDDAILKLKEIKKKYNTLDFDIRPAMLIQVDSKNQKDITPTEYEENINEIILQIEKAGLNYLLYFSDDKRNNCKEEKTLSSASKNSSVYDVIIFKVGPATGWDIPRACMLVQLRSVSSESLNIQTLGRIKRNPEPSLNFNKILDEYYLYSNYQEAKRQLKGYSLKPVYNELELYKGKLVMENEYKKNISSEYLKGFKEKILGNNLICNKAKEFESQEKILIKDEVLQGEKYSSKTSDYIKTIFKLRIYVLNFLRSNSKYFDHNIIEEIKKFSKNKSVNYDLYIFSLSKHIDEIKKEYVKAYEVFEDKGTYSIFGSKLMRYYNIWKNDENKNGSNVGDFSSYGYQLINGENSENRQYLDSYPEEVFLNNILNEIKEEEELNKKIKFFAKMPTLGSPIYFEYLSSKDKEIHKSFIDFVIKFKNKVIMVEVKSFDDYDEEKTQDLKNAYKKYKEEAKESENIDLFIFYAKRDKEPELNYYDKKTKEYKNDLTVRGLFKQILLEENI